MSEAATLLRKARYTAGLTQAELAGRLDVSQAAIAKLERQGANPTVETLDKALWATGHHLVLSAAPVAPSAASPRQPASPISPTHRPRRPGSATPPRQPG